MTKFSALVNVLNFTEDTEMLPVKLFQAEFGRAQGRCSYKHRNTSAFLCKAVLQSQISLLCVWLGTNSTSTDIGLNKIASMFLFFGGN